MVGGGRRDDIGRRRRRGRSCGAALGILPLGTMNLFARSLGIPLDMRAAALELAGRKARLGRHRRGERTLFRPPRRHSGCTRQGSEGAARGSTTVRGYGKMRASLQAWWMVVGRPPTPRYSKISIADAPRDPSAGRWPMLVIQQSARRRTLPYADDPRRAALGLYVAKSLRLPDLLKLAAGSPSGADRRQSASRAMGGEGGGHRVTSSDRSRVRRWRDGVA